MRYVVFLLAAVCALPCAGADIFSSVGRLERLDIFDADEHSFPDSVSRIKHIEHLDIFAEGDYLFPVFFVGDKNPRFELAPSLRPRKDALQMRLDYPDAWKMYKFGEIDEFSHFGFRLYEVERGRVSLKAFLEELQRYLERRL